MPVPLPYRLLVGQPGTNEPTRAALLPLEMLQALGQPVLRQTLRAHQGQLSTLLDRSALPTGVYTLRLHAQEGLVVKRLAKE